jgi:Fur family peroxide stress response transcriptional regulator
MITETQTLPTDRFESRLLEMKTVLEARGAAITPRRAKLLEALLASEVHPTVGEIHDQVRRAFPSTSLATIYNTMELLKATGQVLELQFSGTANRYDGRRPQPHPHLMCLRCDTIEDVDLAGLDEQAEEIGAATGYKIVGRRTDYYGICPPCQAEEED